MRTLNQNEINLFKSDLYPLRLFLEGNGMFDLRIKTVFDVTTFQIATKEELNGAEGIVDNENNSIVVLDTLVSNNYERARTIYHELGHKMLGQKNIGISKYNFLLEKILELKQENPTELPLAPIIYAYGLKCLEEYLVEIFSQTACKYAKGINPPEKRNYLTPSICSDYGYDSNFGNNYGIFQTPCETLINNIFGNNDNAIRASFNLEYFSSFFETSNNVEMMKLLGNLGQIYGATQTKAGYNLDGINQHDPNYIKQLIIDSNTKAQKITRQFPQKSNGRHHK